MRNRDVKRRTEASRKHLSVNYSRSLWFTSIINNRLTQTHTHLCGNALAGVVLEEEAHHI